MLNYKLILEDCLAIIEAKHSTEEKMHELCKYLDMRFDKYDWTGFYMSDASGKMLHLGPYVGEETEHTIIPFGKGICGQAAANKKTFLIDDVNAEDNYISCNIHVKSEIVVPILRDGIVLGQIDIDSNKEAAFTHEDQHLLETICRELSPYI